VDSNETLTAPLRAGVARSSAETIELPRRGARAKLLLGRYRVLGRLGEGGFGVVWHAHDEQLDREVAVKRIALPPAADGGDVSERAGREALATARLAHPAIVALYEARAEDDAFYLISELVHGDTLADLIATDALGDEEILEIGLALSGALEHAHERGVIHRDVKPHNVLVPHDRGKRDEAAKLTDFGGAWMAGEEALTRTGDVLGTLAYMAPEQCEGRPVDEAADLYSLALVLYEALSGSNPVRGATPAATVRRIGRILPELARARADLPRGLTDAIDVALAPLPEHRGTLAELHDELQSALSGEHTAPTPRRPILPRRRPRMAEPVAPREQAERAPHPGAAPGPERLGRLAGALPAAALIGAACAWLGPAPPLPAGLACALALLAVAALPRMGWLAAVVSVILWQLAAGRSGTALLLAAAVLPVAPLLRRAGPEWSAAALAPLLGLAGLAAAFPALAGQAPRWRARAALGALGYWWLLLAEPLLHRRLWLGAPAAVQAHAAWESSLSDTAVHVLGPLLGLGLLFGALLWAVGAVVLPWVVRGRSGALDLVAITVWSTGMIAAAPLLDRGLPGSLGSGDPRGAVGGALLGGALAIGVRALRGPV
jgi:hypothetical protein